MILNPGQAIICYTYEEYVSVAQMLEDAGYKMFNSQFWPSIVGLVHDEKRRCGFRWLEGTSYPECIATLTDGFADDVVQHGELICQGVKTRFTWMTASEVLYPISRVAVEDLI